MSLWYSPATRLVDRFLHERLVSRIWERDPRAWGADAGSADERSIRSRLGWLDVPETMSAGVPRAARLAQQIAAEQFDAVYLLGMGGSSLCAEVLRLVCGVAPGHPELFVLDTTDELTITTAAARLDPARTLFVVASKSGGTVEVASLERFFWARMVEAEGSAAGRHFIAITDPGTALQSLAESKHYREVFVNPADIGGRFSALSLFGLVPCALIGADPGALLAAGAAMAEGCKQENHANAGLALGAFIGAAALEGRDKLTLALPPSLASLGLWIEQLVAESTGKHGKGALPVVDEPLGNPDEYGSDRAFVAIATDRDAPDEARIAALEAAGHPVLRLSTRIRRARRRVLPLGVCDSGRGGRARHQSVRRAERRRGQGENQRSPQHVRIDGAACRKPARRPRLTASASSLRRSRGIRRLRSSEPRSARSGLETMSRSCPTSLLRATSSSSSAKSGSRSACNSEWQARSVSGRGTSTRRASTTRVDRTPCWPSS